MTSGQINVFRSTGDFDSAAVQEIVGVTRAAISERGFCIISLSGGETPRRIYRRLGMHPEQEQIDWKRVHLIFGDERMVPPDDSQSNFGMVEHELLAHLPIPAGNVDRIRGELVPAIAAREYAEELKQLFISTTARLDLVLLGVGEDGHTASLFPGTDVLDVTEENVKDVFVPGLRVWRVTITLPLINDARQVLFLCSGAQKAPIVEQILNAPGPMRGIPATLVRPRDGVLKWILDGDAALSYQHL